MENVVNNPPSGGGNGGAGMIIGIVVAIIIIVLILVYGIPAIRGSHTDNVNVTVPVPATNSGANTGGTSGGY